MAEREATGPTVDSILGRMVLGKYRVVRRLAGGGMGSVYLLHHVELPDTFAALKVLGGDAGLGVEMRERFRQEALVAAAVGSHRVVRPLDVGEFDDGLPYIVMEYVEGLSLAQELEARGPMPTAAALLVALRVADTMAIAHGKSIVHRDLKPPNIMLVNEGDDRAVRLLDFGVARASGTLKVAHTAESVIVGTPGYMSPEAVSGTPVDGRTDVFSLGVTLFEILTGELPFPAPSVQDAILNVLKKEPAPLVSDLRPAALDAVPEVVERLVARALEKDMLRRPAMAELHRALRDALEQMPSGKQARLPSAQVRLKPSVTDSPTLAKAPPANRAARFQSDDPVREPTGPTRMESNPTIILLNPSEKKQQKARWGRMGAIGLACVAMVAAGMLAGRGRGSTAMDRAPDGTAIPGPRSRVAPSSPRAVPGHADPPRTITEAPSPTTSAAGGAALPAGAAPSAGSAPSPGFAPSPSLRPASTGSTPVAPASPARPVGAYTTAAPAPETMLAPPENAAEAAPADAPQKGARRDRRGHHGHAASANGDREAGHHGAGGGKAAGRPAERSSSQAGSQGGAHKPMERFVDPFAAPAFGTTSAKRPAPRPVSAPRIKESLDGN